MNNYNRRQAKVNCDQQASVWTFTCVTMYIVYFVHYHNYIHYMMMLMLMLDIDSFLNIYLSWYDVGVGNIQ